MGLDGIMVEVHKCPDNAKSDAKQTIDYETYKKISEYVGKFNENRA